jgi:hypothetical protein
MPLFVETEFDQHLVDMLLTTAAPGQYAARNAVRHLDKAGEIAEIDPTMAAFRAITAEEEAATAVFHALRRHGYAGSTILHRHNHLHKNALGPFCEATIEVFKLVNDQFDLRPQLLIAEEDGTRRLKTQFRIAVRELGERLASGALPLGFSLSRNGQLHDFSDQIDNLATSRGAASIKAHLRQRANMRNELLYAGPSGLPTVRLNNFLRTQRRAVKMLVILFLLIEPYAEQQLFVSQCLKAFLKMLDVLPDDLVF